jgi:hypothetical protein
MVEKLRESDDEFDPDDATSTDDEETIAQEETLDSCDAAKNKDREKEEIDALKRESEIPLEDLLDDLPPEYFENLGKPDADVDKADEVDISDLCESYYLKHSYKTFKFGHWNLLQHLHLSIFVIRKNSLTMSLK